MSRVFHMNSEFKMQIKLLNRLKNVKWKNGRAAPNCAYIPTPVEHCANVLTHAIWILPSLIGLHNLLAKSQTTAQFVAAVIYGSSMILLFTVSTFFHSVFFCTGHSSLKEFLHRCDRAVIYIFIAGSYCPWSLLEDYPEGSLSAHICWLIWVLACLGITYQQLFHERFKMLETLFYCFMGVVPSLIIIYQQVFLMDHMLFANNCLECKLLI